MEFRSGNPGAVQFGNFINYYPFNSAIERLKLLPTHVWKAPPLERPTQKDAEVGEGNTDGNPYLVLDVGCNSGVFTQLLWKFLTEQTCRPVHVLGVDLDNTLIARAQETNRHEPNISFTTVDVMDQEDFCQIENYMRQYQRSKFDVVCCFSITMWIHLNHHDCGLKQFLRTLTSLADLFVVEPQPWKCYQTAEKRMKKAGEQFPLFMALKWRTRVEEEIQTFLEAELGRCKIFECSPTKWRRRICFYR